MRTLNLSISEDVIRRMTLKVENDWSNPPMYSGVDRELLGSIYSLVNIPKELYETIRDFMAPPLAEPKEFGAMVEASTLTIDGSETIRQTWIHLRFHWISEKGYMRQWRDLINPKLISK